MHSTEQVKAFTAIIEKQYAFQLDYARRLVADLDEEQVTTTGGPGLENHPAFTLGHLVTGAWYTLRALGQDVALPAGWMKLFGREGPSDRRLPESEDSAYPSVKKILEELERLHERTISVLQSADAGFLAEPLEWRLDSWMPSRLDAVVFLMTGHESLHLGQLAAWRRGMRLPAAMATMK